MGDVPVSLIVGLGNPGSDYAQTRHNVGWMLLDRVRERIRQVPPDPMHTAESLVWDCRWAGRPLSLVKPLTWMNLSGEAVGLLCRRRELPPAAVLLLYDDLDLPVGRLRLRQGGSSGGHRGVESVIQHLGTARFPRLRLGIGRGVDNAARDHVLSEFEADEIPVVDRVLEAAADAVFDTLRRGLEPTMSHYNALRFDNDNDEEPEL